ncbi:SDR family NAD(P)-dependent oxidoreductase [Candidatus Woesearchaeota archaeon]|nr:SDR family NAD(P)-dependent oxidoreductase [Candidatus Woesearchaeota archaeon]
MTKKILVTGGAGFIGSFLVDELVKRGNAVRILDNLEEQVHQKKKPGYLNTEAEFILGDVRNEEDWDTALKDIEVVFHLAAAVGVGQSMYQVSHYVNTNTLGTAKLLDALANKEHDVKKMVVAASMSSYGEGAYKCPDCGVVYPPLRTETQMQAKKWELFCPNCSKPLKPVPTDENKIQYCNSIYAITKKDQEDLVLNIGQAYGIPSVALRFFNVYGPRQSLSNPYTGVAAIFMSRIKNGNAPIVYEDGLQTRDFVSVHDIVRALCLAMDKSAANYERFNVGTGKPLTIKSIAETLAKLYGVDIRPKITQKFRKGDVRNCYADISKIRSKLGFEPRVEFEKGMAEFIAWSREAESVDKFEKATQELKQKGLL